MLRPEVLAALGAVDGGPAPEKKPGVDLRRNMPLLVGLGVVAAIVAALAIWLMTSTVPIDAPVAPQCERSKGADAVAAGKGEGGKTLQIGQGG